MGGTGAGVRTDRVGDAMTEYLMLHRRSLMWFWLTWMYGDDGEAIEN